MTRILPSIRDAIGDTPLVRAERYAAAWDHELLLKCEFMNPGGSVKDRIAFRTVDDAERRGLIKPGDTLVEATASNTGFGLGMVAASGSSATGRQISSSCRSRSGRARRCAT